MQTVGCAGVEEFYAGVEGCGFGRGGEGFGEGFFEGAGFAAEEGAGLRVSYFPILESAGMKGESESGNAGEGKYGP